MPRDSLALARAVTIDAKPKQVFEYVADYANVLRFMHNLTRFEPFGDRTYGLGARFYWETVLRGFRVGWQFVVSEFRPYETMSAKSLSAPHSTSRWQFRPVGAATCASFAISTEVPTLALGVGRWLIERELASTIERSLVKLKSLLEHP